MKVALANPGVDIWAHPGLFLVRNGLRLEKEQLEEVSELICGNNVAVEVNKKHNLPPEEWREMLSAKVSFVRGSDVHSVEELAR